MEKISIFRHVVIIFSDTFHQDGGFGQPVMSVFARVYQGMFKRADNTHPPKFMVVFLETKNLISETLRNLGCFRNSANKNVVVC